jgi:DNA end-binding protein Ku
MLWDDEVREAAFDVLDTTPRISAKERELAAQIVDSLAADFDSSEFKDDYQEQLRTLVEAKLEKGDSLDTEATFGEQEKGEEADVVDLMDALRRSVDKKKGAKKAAAPKRKQARKRA